MHCEFMVIEESPKTMTNKYTNNTMNNPQIILCSKGIYNKQTNKKIEIIFIMEKSYEK